MTTFACVSIAAGLGPSLHSLHSESLFTILLGFTERRSRANFVPERPCKTWMPAPCRLSSEKKAATASSVTAACRAVLTEIAKQPEAFPAASDRGLHLSAEGVYDLLMPRSHGEIHAKWGIASVFRQTLAWASGHAYHIYLLPAALPNLSRG